MNNWLYKLNPITSLEDFPEGTYGFIYEVEHKPSGKRYIGKKVLYHNKKKKLTKKELAEQTGRGRKSTTKTIQVESDWKTYYGSHSEIKKLIKEGKQNEFKRFIFHFAFNKKHLTYLECKTLFKLNILEQPDIYLNDNILGKFFRKDFNFKENLGFKEEFFILKS